MSRCVQFLLSTKLHLTENRFVFERYSRRVLMNTVIHSIWIATCQMEPTRTADTWIVMSSGICLKNKITQIAFTMAEVKRCLK